MRSFLKSGFLSAYTLVKIPFNNVDDPYLKRILKPILTMLGIVLLIFMCSLSAPFVCFRYLVYLYLKVKHGRGFIKITNFQSATFRYCKHTTIKSVFYISCDSISDFQTELRPRIQKALDEWSELRSEIKSCLGYRYLLKKQMNVDDVLSVVSFEGITTLSNYKLCQYLAAIELSDKEVFQINVFQQPTKENRYVLLFLFHHSIIDGYGIRAVYDRYLFDGAVKKIKTIVTPSETKLDDLYVNPGYFKPVAPEEEYLPCDSVYYAMFADETTTYLSKLKVLKSELNCSLNEIIISTLTYTLFRYADNLGELPKRFSIFTNDRGNEPQQQSFKQGYCPLKDIDTTVIFVLCRINLLKERQHFFEFFEAVRNTFQQNVESMAGEITRFSVKYLLDYLPAVTYRKTVKSECKRFVIVCSNTGVIPSKSICGRTVHSFLTAMTTTVNSGIYVGYQTYDGKLQIMLSTKLHFLRSETDLQIILDKSISLIDRLYDDLQVA